MRCHTTHLCVKGYLIPKSARDYIKCCKSATHVNRAIKHLNINLKPQGAQILKGLDPERIAFFFFLEQILCFLLENVKNTEKEKECNHP